MTAFKCSRVVPVLLLLLLSLTLTCVVASLHLWYTYTNELLDLLTVECVCVCVQVRAECTPAGDHRDLQRYSRPFHRWCRDGDRWPVPVSVPVAADHVRDSSRHTGIPIRH
jgi:hypothetical protein